MKFIKPIILLTLFFFCAGVVSCIGRGDLESTSENNSKQPKSKKFTDSGKENSHSLPSFSSPSLHCRGHGSDYLSLKKWIQNGDGLIYGEVARVEPANNMGWTHLKIKNGSRSNRLKNKKECVKIDGAFKITLKDVRGYLHGKKVPSKMDIYFGASSNKIGIKLPRKKNGSIKWPQRKSIHPGMNIGGLVYYNKYVDRWSFRPSTRKPIFEIKKDGVAFQKISNLDENKCLEWPPMNKLKGVSARDVSRMINGISDLYVPPENREWDYPSRNNKISKPFDFLGVCITRKYINERNKKTKCKDNSDCSSDEVCFKGSCKPSP